MQKFERATAQTFSPSEGITCYYWVMGNKKNHPVLIIPGFTGTHTDLLALARELEKDYFLIIPDMPGWGASEALPEKLTMETYALYIHQLLKSMGLEKVSVVGHCMGAVVAIQFAYNFKSTVTNLVLISTPYLKGSWSLPLFLHLGVLSERSPKRIQPLFFLWRSVAFNIPYSFYAIQSKSLKKRIHLIGKMIKQQPLQNEKAVEENWISMMRFNYNIAKKLTCPVHLLHGENDRMVPVKQALKFSRLIPNASLEFIPYAGHVPPLESVHALGNLVKKNLQLKS